MPTIEFRVDVTGMPPHSFIIINNGAGFEQGYGFKPAEKLDPMGPGHVYPDTDAPYDFTTGPIQVTNEQYNAIAAKINADIANPPYYNAPGSILFPGTVQQCAQWVMDVAQHGNVSLPFTMHRGGWNPYGQAIWIGIDSILAQIDTSIAASTGGTYRVVYYSYDPLVLDLDGDGIETVASNGLAGALFDQNGDGIRTATGWVKSDDGILVRDINGNGTIDGGAEVFGDSTALAAGGTAADGFAALSGMDSNGDGVVNSADANFSQLQIWRDLNQNGVSDAGELFTTGQLGIQSLNTAASNTTPAAVAGGSLAATGSYMRTDGTVSTMGDVNLTQDTFHTRYTNQIVVPVALQNLPNVGGMGRLRDLQQAAALSPALVSALGLYNAATTSIERKALLGQVLIEWSKTDPLYSATPLFTYHYGPTYDPNSTNVIYLLPGQSLPAWNDTVGSPVSQDIVDKVRVVDAIRGGAITNSMYGSNPAQGMIDAYNAIADSFFNNLETIRLQPLFDLIGIKIDGGGFSFDLSGVQTELGNRIASNTPGGVSDLLSFSKIVETQGLLKDTDWASRELSLLDSVITSTSMTSTLQAVLNDYGVITTQAGLTTSGTAQTELIIGSAQGDVINGNGGNDLLLGGEGDDTINAGAGKDVIYGGNGNDTLNGYGGDDILNGGTGNDILNGGTGNDTYLYAAGSGQDTITDYDTTTGNIDTIKMVGLLPSQITFTREIGSDGYLTNDLVLKVIGTTDSLRIKNYYADAAYKIEKLLFDDGTVWGTAELNAAVILPTGSTLHTTSGNDLVDLRNAAGTTVSGVYYSGTGYGNDTYLFAAGSGQDVITDYDPTAGNIDTVKLVGLNPSQITFTREIASDGYLTNDLVLKVIGTTDSLRISNYYADAAYKIEKLLFDDGTVWGTAELNAAVILPTGSTLHTTSGNDLVDLRNAAGTTVSGVYYSGTGYGNDTYLFAAGAGQDTIYDYDPAAGNIDTIKMMGLLPSQISFARELGSDGMPTNDLVIKVVGTTDSLRIKNYYASPMYKIEKLEFADGTVWGTAELDAAVIDLRASSNDSVRRGDYVTGNDTYLFAAGAGQDTIYDYDPAAGNIDTIKMMGLLPSQISFARELGSDGMPTNDLVIKVVGTTDSLRIKNYYASPVYKIEKLLFDDGSTLDNIAFGFAGNDILKGTDGNDALSDTGGKNLLIGGAGSDMMTGNSGNEMFVGGTGNDTITTGSGADIIAFNRGDGRDVVNGGIGTDNTIILGKGISYADIALSKVNNDLIIEVGPSTSSGQASEQLTLSNWYDTTANFKSVLNLQVMADAMAGFNATSTDPLLNQAVQNFDFTAIVASFDQARGTSETFMHWSATNSLLAAHLAGSDVAAIGGDIAHQYGTNGSLTGMNLTAAQDVLNATQFGAQAQTLHPLQGLQGGAVTL